MIQNLADQSLNPARNKSSRGGADSQDKSKSKALNFVAHLLDRETSEEIIAKIEYALLLLPSTPQSLSRLLAT